jgi:hypothetical protein
MQPNILSFILKCHLNDIQLQHVSAFQGHLQAVVHHLKLPHYISSYMNASHAIAYRR